MKIIIIDDSKDYRALVRLYLSRHFKVAHLVDYEIETLGKPGPDFDWSRYDVLLLDYNLGGGEDGFTWLKEFSAMPGFPPAIVMTAEGDEYIAVKAIKLGAADYLNKLDLTPQRLVEAIIEATEYTPEKKAEQEKDKIHAEHLVQELYDRNQKANKKPEIGSAYKFVRVIGQGAMSKVYLAERQSDQLSLVLKILEINDVTDDVAVVRFMQEAELVSKLSSPFVVKIYDYGLANNYCFIAMEFFSRGDLKQRMELRLTPDLAVNYMTHIAYGLDAIHKIGVVHRDLKPANIMFRGDDSLALADFGISKKLDAPSELTTLGQILGTPHYMSPEQGEGKMVDARSDIYSAGILFYELLTRKKPYTATTPAALIYQHVYAPVPELPPELARYQGIIDKTLAKHPGERYQTAVDLIQVLESL